MGDRFITKGGERLYINDQVFIIPPSCRLYVKPYQYIFKKELIAEKFEENEKQGDQSALLTKKFFSKYSGKAFFCYHRRTSELFLQRKLIDAIKSKKQYLEDQFIWAFKIIYAHRQNWYISLLKQQKFQTLSKKQRRWLLSFTNMEIATIIFRNKFKLIIEKSSKKPQLKHLINFWIIYSDFSSLQWKNEKELQCTDHFILNQNYSNFLGPTLKIQSIPLNLKKNCALHPLKAQFDIKEFTEIFVKQTFSSSWFFKNYKISSFYSKPFSDLNIKQLFHFPRQYNTKVPYTSYKNLTHSIFKSQLATSLRKNEKNLDFELFYKKNYFGVKNNLPYFFIKNKTSLIDWNFFTSELKQQNIRFFIRKESYSKRMFFFQEIFTQNFHTQFYLHLNFIFQQNRKQKQQFFPNIFILIRPLLSELLAIGTTNWVYETQTKKAFFNAIDYDNCGAILQFPVSMKKDYTCFSFNKSYFVFQSFRKCIFYFPQQQKRREIRPDQKAKSNKSLFITYGNQKSETDLLPVPLHQRDHCFFIDDSTFATTVAL